ncbi:MAG TPA: hypothetical protein VJH89_02795, partial [Patescibacteria group bacterium]|nr:hypothetical protein [Patescibacteria group bacterium]
MNSGILEKLKQQFQGKNEALLGGTPSNGVSVPPAEGNIVFLEKPIAVGQQWQTPDGQSIISIHSHSEKNDVLRIVLQDKRTNSSDTFDLPKGELIEILNADKYQVFQEPEKIASVPNKTDAADTKTPKPPLPDAASDAGMQTASLDKKIAWESREETINTLLQTYNDLQKAIRELLKKGSSDGILRPKQRDDFYAQYKNVNTVGKKNLVAAMKERVKAQNDIVEQQGVTNKFVQFQNDNIQFLQDKIGEMKQLQTSIQNVLDAQPPQQPTMKSQEIWQQAGQNRLKNKQDKKGEKLPDDTAFKKLLETVKINQVFRKGKEPWLIIRAIDTDSIGIEYRTDTDPNNWTKEIVGPQQAQKFLKQLETTFRWDVKKKQPFPQKKISSREPAKAPAAPIDQDDAAREALLNNPRMLDYEQAQVLAREDTPIQNEEKETTGALNKRRRKKKSTPSSIVLRSHLSVSVEDKKKIPTRIEGYFKIRKTIQDLLENNKGVLGEKYEELFSQNKQKLEFIDQIIIKQQAFVKEGKKRSMSMPLELLDAQVNNKKAFVNAYTELKQWQVSVAKTIQTMKEEKAKNNSKDIASVDITVHAQKIMEVIAEILEKNKEILGEKYNEFLVYSKQEEQQINGLLREKTNLTQQMNNARSDGKRPAPALLKARIKNQEHLLKEYQDLKQWQVAVVNTLQTIKGEKEKTPSTTLIQNQIENNTQAYDAQKKRQFIQSIPEGHIIKFISPDGKEQYFHREGNDLIEGKRGTSGVGTNTAWEHIKEKWRMEVLSPESVEQGASKKNTIPVLTQTVSPEEIEALRGTPASPTELPTIPPAPEIKNKNIHTTPQKIDASATETLQSRIDRLRTEMEDARAKYVKEDYDNTTAWKKIVSLFHISPDKQKGEWQGVYEEKLAALQRAEIEQLRTETGTAVEKMQHQSEQLLRYYTLDERTNLINERTQYRATHSTLGEKVGDVFGVIGREWNRLSLKQKLLITATCVGVTLATPASGGVAGVVGGLMIMKRAVAGIGLAVGVEALLDKSRERFETKQANKSVDERITFLNKETRQMSGMPKNHEHTFTAAYLEKIETMLATDIEKLDVALQQAKRIKTYQKLGAITVGVAVGSGWLTSIIMEKLGGGEILATVLEKNEVLAGALQENIESVQDVVEEKIQQTEDILQQTETTPVIVEAPVIEGETTVSEGALPVDAIEKTEMSGGVATPSGVPEVISAEFDPTVLENIERAGLPPVAPVSELVIPTNTETINQFVNQDIVVQKGDSVWKISGRLADQLGLQGAEKTHFIDALKDQYGDVQLKAGETINLADHGIDKEFVENALGKTEALSPEQLASIDANDAKIAEFAKEHPDVTLTNESVDTVLHEDVSEIPSSAVPDVEATPVADTASGTLVSDSEVSLVSEVTP